MDNRYDFTIKQGTYFYKKLTWKDGAGNPIDITGYSARLQAREDANALLSINLASPSNITLGGTSGTIEISMNDTDTTALNFNVAKYNLELVSISGRPTRLLEGYITLSKDVA